jgi:cytoplasmic tRNA 2-thiolation protein 2
MSHASWHLIQNLDLPLFILSDHASPTERLRNYLSSLPTQTAITTTVKTLIRVLLLTVARSTGSSHILLGTSLTSLSISLISSISQGGGFAVRETQYEEWDGNLGLKQPLPDSATKPGYLGPIRIVRPLHDVADKECGAWSRWASLNVVGRDKWPGSRQDIEGLTQGMSILYSLFSFLFLKFVIDFIIGLERDYPSTVSTIAKTCAKLAPKADRGGICLLCEL